MNGDPNSPALPETPQPAGNPGDVNFNVITPKMVFSLADFPQSEKDKLRDEIMDKVKSWESRMSNGFFDAYFAISDSWRVKPAKQGRQGGKTLFKSKSGETHRAAETLATVWQRMLTASDKYFGVTKRGLNPGGFEVSEEQLYAVENILLEQQRASQFKRKLLRSLRSASLMGVTIAEEPWLSLPYGWQRKHMEFTDWQFRPMIRTGFDTAVCDIRDSDYIFTVDFVSKWMLRNQMSLFPESWDTDLTERHIKDFENGPPSYATSIYNRIRQSRSRAGYADVDVNVFENINYHGRLEEGKSIQSAYAGFIGLKDDPKFMDWSVGILDGNDISKFHMTQYGDWRTRFRVLSYKEFEDEPLPYGVGQIGRRLQREMDINESMMNDLLTAFTLMMWKVGKFSGYTEKQFVWEPLKMIEMEDISQLVPLIPDPAAFRVGLEMIGFRREDFRNIVGAQTNLQAQVTKASATESALAQTEAIRSASVHAEILAEALREHLEISHVNNLNYLDEPIWAGMTGSEKPKLINRFSLPINVGFEIKVVTDKDFRPERIKNLMQMLQILTSVRNFVPTSMNAIRPIFEELFRSFDLNPRLLAEPMPQADAMEMNVNRLLTSGHLQQQGEGEQAGEQAGSASIQETPMGPVPTSPSPMPMESSAA